MALLVEAADAAHLSGALDRAQALLALALSEVGDGGAPERRATVLERRARLMRDLGRGRAAIEDLNEALRILPPEEDTVLHAATLSSLARLQMLAADSAATRDAGRRAVEAARRVGAPREEAEARITLGVALGWLDELDEGLEELRRGVAIARDGGYPATALRGAINLAHVLEMNGRSAEAAAVAGDNMAVAERSGMMRTLGDFLAGNLVESLLHLGEWARAEAIIEKGLRTRPEGVYAATLLEVRAQLGVLTGRYPEARESITEARRVLEDEQDYEFVQSMTFTTASLLIHDGEPERGLDLIVRTLPPPSAPSPYAWPLAWLGARTAADLAGGRPVDERIAGWVERMGTGLAPQRAYRAMAQAELRRSAGAATSGDWTGAAEQWRALQWPYPLAYSLWRAAEAAGAEGDAATAGRTAAEAGGFADRLGAAPLADRIREFVEREHLADGRSPDLEGRLTSRELEVLRLLAAGRTNPQIAGELFISPKTASVHVSNILAKLEVGTRVEAAGIAHRLGLLPQG